jgi:hypothetical protein
MLLFHAQRMRRRMYVVSTQKVYYVHTHAAVRFQRVSLVFFAGLFVDDDVIVADAWVLTTVVAAARRPRQMN